jgi:trehalose 6-phosphate phosphatase
MLDVDGTLAPIVSHPSLARVPDATRRLVSTFAARDDVRVVIVSGRAAADARRLVGASRAWVVGNHGAEVVTPQGDVVVDERVAPYATAMAQTASAITAALAAIPGILVQDKRWSLAIHWRMVDPGIGPRLRSRVASLAAEYGLRLTEGKRVFEIRPPVAVDKGTAVVRLAEELGAFEPAASLLYAGDDITDEDAFRALRARAPRAITIHVGSGQLGDEMAGQPSVPTTAEFVLASTDELHRFLESLLRDRS